MTRVMSDEEAEEYILAMLREAREPLLTREIEERMHRMDGQCPDSSVRFLNRLRLQGKIKGKLSIERRGWIWWVERE
ncbi:MAG: hypothetical protein J7L61_03290 [Thermoplasmata archaeon]|nr:hypothetical protein [Thermoplasmata archaeon]